MTAAGTGERGTGRARSLWGWGFADRLPDDDGRRAIAGSVSAMLAAPGEGGPSAFEGIAPMPLPAFDAVSLPAPRLVAPGALAAICTSDRTERILHTYGRAYRDLVRGLQGDFSAAPDLVARPSTEDEVDAVLAWASRAKIAVVPYGGGTSVVGGVECRAPAGFAGVVSLDLQRLDRVVEVDPVSRAARIQAGVLGPALEAQLAPHGLTLRHYPQSFELSTLGGWIATRAGGHFATLYTHIDDLVESVRMCTPSGRWATRRLPGSGAGPSPDRLAIGSEGALGVITEAWMRLQARPRYRTSASVHFREWTAAVSATRALAQSGLYPTNCRLLDAGEARLNFVTDDGAHVLLVAFESADHDGEAAMARAMALCASHGGAVPRGVTRRDDGEKAADASAGSAWKAAFLEAPYLQSVLVSCGLIADTFETACTWDRFDAMHAAVSAAARDAMRRVCGGGHLSCRFTHVYPDGPAPYYTFLARARAGEELAQWAEIKRAASDALLAHGATITHHHAVGRTHRPWYDQELPAPFAAALKAAKRALDPAGILNPGVLVDP